MKRVLFGLVFSIFAIGGCGGTEDLGGSCMAAATHVNDCFGLQVTDPNTGCDLETADRVMTMTCAQLVDLDDMRTDVDWWCDYVEHRTPGCQQN